VVEWRQDASRKLGPAVPVDQLEHGVQLDLAVAGKPSGQIRGRPRVEEAAAPPPDDGVGPLETGD